MFIQLSYHIDTKSKFSLKKFMFLRFCSIFSIAYITVNSYHLLFKTLFLLALKWHWSQSKVTFPWTDLMCYFVFSIFKFIVTLITVKFMCEEGTYKFKWKRNMEEHIKYVHRNDTFHWDQCNGSAIKKCLKKFMIAVHLSKYDYKSKPKQNLRKHKKGLNRSVNFHYVQCNFKIKRKHSLINLSKLNYELCWCMTLGFILLKFRTCSLAPY